LKSVHIPVLAQEAVSYLNIQRDGTYVDATFGGGGHAGLILERLGEAGRLVAFDRNPEAVALAEAWRAESESIAERFRIVGENFRVMDQVLDRLELERVDGCLFDIGLSSDLLESARGFSFREEAPLDMRFDAAGDLTAADLIETLEEADLIEIFTQFGEEPFSRRIARRIVEAREARPIRTTKELADLVKSVVPSKPGGKHPATRVFQALRIVVNQEFQSLQEGLEAAVKRLRPGGRLVVITFHSLEDRIVKKFLRRHAGQCVCFKPPELCTCDRREDLKILTEKPVTPEKSEIKTNPRARSAKLRAAQKN
jgi:16S rRNA (cytosine1402-N4)-methyltransferase